MPLNQPRDQNPEPKILVITTMHCSYPGVDNAGQQHLEYPPNSFVIEVPSPVMLPERFFYRSFRKGIDGILIFSCGEECPFPGGFHQLSIRVNKMMQALKATYNLDPQRIKLTSICSVCAKHVVKHIKEMDTHLRTLPPVRDALVQHGVEPLLVTK